jgi:P27 family predicted phage terminase small subunit
MDKLTAKQSEAYQRIKTALRSARHIGELDEDLLKMAACLSVEVAELQALIDKKGYTYEFKNREGGTMTKHRPEHQMLVESRSKYLVVLKELGMTPAARKRIEVEVELDDELEQLLTFKDA